MVHIIFPIKSGQGHALSERKRVEGFTLMELIIVIGILSLLMIAGLASYTGSQRRARDSRRKIDLETLRQALEIYKSRNGNYPSTSGSTEGALKTTLTSGNYISSTSYPKDQTASQQYYYSGSGQTYFLCANLEAGPGTGDVDCAAVSPDCDSSGGTADCNLGLVEP